eukprot:TRINITY_DN66555_c0_g1_i1.p1 TRINITY_DN66555_c0_g1~~TRINITY_DN66555_c0_g1_i1.p1  ORF type:complete len:229 (-),score=50.20 TRINITY_DN66555_c0_g1_i1:301-918(-)
MSVAAGYFAELGLYDAVVVSPDAGGVTRAKDFLTTMEAIAVKIGAREASRDYRPQKLAMIVKQRSGASQIDQMDLVGQVDGQDVIIVDDILDTAGTLCKAAEECRQKGARRVFAFCTHGLFSGSACRTLAEACAAGNLENIIVTNTLPQMRLSEFEAACGDLPMPRLKILTIAPLLAEAIKRLGNKERLHLTAMREHMIDSISKL